jgi:hypothetical protein
MSPPARVSDGASAAIRENGAAEHPEIGIPRAEFAGLFPGCMPRAGKLRAMSDTSHFTVAEARTAGEQIGIDWATSRFAVEQFRIGMDVELEHGMQDPDTNVTDDDMAVTAKIARAHLNEFPDYYTRLAAMEAEAEAYWRAQRP